MKYRTDGIGKNKKIKAERMKPLPLMDNWKCHACKKPLEDHAKIIYGTWYYCPECAEKCLDSKS